MCGIYLVFYWYLACLLKLAFKKCLPDRIRLSSSMYGIHDKIEFRSSLIRGQVDTEGAAVNVSVVTYSRKPGRCLAFQWSLTRGSRGGAWTRRGHLLEEAGPVLGPVVVTYSRKPGRCLAFQWSLTRGSQAGAWRFSGHLLEEAGPVLGLVVVTYSSK